MTSDYEDEDIVVQHKHCPVCGRAMPLEEEYCSEECREKMEVLVKKKKMFYYVYMFLMVFIIALIFLSYLGGGA
ncbi:MAG: DUF2116 family Zn-ribbon domain-containing protein [Thermoplasmata archaeon]|nr:DUF2116 family Zn-ribbon domain-containing protein [Thermoplasmata archaeon]